MSRTGSEKVTLTWMQNGVPNLIVFWSCSRSLIYRLRTCQNGQVSKVYCQRDGNEISLKLLINEIWLITKLVRSIQYRILSVLWIAIKRKIWRNKACNIRNRLFFRWQEKIKKMHHWINFSITTPSRQKSVTSSFDIQISSLAVLRA